MKRLWICLLMVVIIAILVIYYSIKLENMVKDHKYDSVINQVITIENLKLAEQGLVSKENIIPREEIGTAIYADGKYVRLIYELRPNKQTDVFYEFNEETDSYIEMKHISDDVWKLLEDEDYKENIGIK